MGRNGQDSARLTACLLHHAPIRVYEANLVQTDKEKASVLRMAENPTASASSVLIILRITSPPNSLLENLKPSLNLNKYENQRETRKSILQTNHFDKWIFITIGAGASVQKAPQQG